ncbi:virion envelope protein [Finch poxvirus]|uniref:Virion envelope protein n=2 Tax=unclassified Avipoxvirus TaxID=336487 RepID=A0AAT9UQP6_9POXV|nr:virion envelope protein [Finch poxvirus]UOX39200.1 virion envelope protein [Finch poxvirus]
MDPIGFLKNKPSYVVALGIVLLIVACILAYVELYKSEKPIDTPLRVISIISFIVAMILILGIVFFKGYSMFCGGSTAEEIARYPNSNDIEVQ